jgi:hypothetical protein
MAVKVAAIGLRLSCGIFFSLEGCVPQKSLAGVGWLADLRCWMKRDS